MAVLVAARRRLVRIRVIGKIVDILWSGTAMVLVDHHAVVSVGVSFFVGHAAAALPLCFRLAIVTFSAPASSAASTTRLAFLACFFGLRLGRGSG